MSKMSIADMDIIGLFARTDSLYECARTKEQYEARRSAAIEAHHRNIPIVGVRGNAYQQFMAEIDHPVPDLILRRTYRDAVIKAEDARRKLERFHKDYALGVDFTTDRLRIGVGIYLDTDRATRPHLIVMLGTWRIDFGYHRRYSLASTLRGWGRRLGLVK